MAIIEPQRISEVLLITPDVRRDDRGTFLETWNEHLYEKLGLKEKFVQDNFSASLAGVVRGLHAQRSPHGQGKLICVLQGRIFDVAVDARTESPTFGKHVSVELDSRSFHQLFVPAGFLHGFLVLEGPALVSYKCTAAYAPGAELTVRWDDPELGIHWPFTEQPIVSEKDRNGLSFADLRMLSL